MVPEELFVTPHNHVSKYRQVGDKVEVAIMSILISNVISVVKFTIC